MSEPVIPKGCILLARKIIESEIWDKPPLYIKVWIYLLTRAQYSDFKQLKRGQLRTSIPDLIEACSWKVGARKERPTKDQIYQILEWLRNPNNFKKGNKECTKTLRSSYESNVKTSMITTTKATQGLLITIDNYSIYQDIGNYESNDEGNDKGGTKAQRRQRQPDNINKNDKECIKNDKEEKTTSPEPADLQIKDLRQRYSQNQLRYIDDYLDVIRHTRRSAKIADSVKLKIYQKFDKFPTVCVEYAVRTHADKTAYHSKDETYTFGILRKTTAEEATRKLAAMQQESRKGGLSPEELEELEKEMLGGENLENSRS